MRITYERQSQTIKRSRPLLLTQWPPISSNKENKPNVKITQLKCPQYKMQVFVYITKFDVNKNVITTIPVNLLKVHDSAFCLLCTKKAISNAAINITPGTIHTLHCISIHIQKLQFFKNNSNRFVCYILLLLAPLSCSLLLLICYFQQGY